MRTLSLLLALFLLAGTVSAQQATSSAPVARNSEDNRRTESYCLSRTGWEVTVSVRDSGGVLIRTEAYTGPDATHPGATAAAFNTAVSHTILGTETGANSRKTDFRILTFLKAQNYLAASDTIVP